MNELFNKKIIDYYTKYYRDDCSLPDWRKRAEDRLKEEDDELEKMNILQKIIGLKFDDSQKHFIVGAGTGGLAVALNNNFKCDVYGIEPEPEAFEIILEKLKQNNISENNFKKEFGENLSFPDNEFDFVHCFTVLEHVKDIEKCIDEMVRIARPCGLVYINTPNYNFPYERHYKIIFPTFLPKIFGYLFLIFLGKSPKFLRTINFINEKKLNKIFLKKTNIVWQRIYRSKKENSKGRLGFLWNFLIKKMFIYPTQEILIRKME